MSHKNAQRHTEIDTDRYRHRCTHPQWTLIPLGMRSWHENTYVLLVVVSVKVIFPCSSFSNIVVSGVSFIMP